MAENRIALPILAVLLALSSQIILSSSSPPPESCQSSELPALESFLYQFSSFENCGSSFCSCSWRHVQCDEETGYVTALHLSHCNGNFTIASDSTLFLLSHLEVLDLSFNKFTSPLPNEIGKLSGLRELNLAENQFTGSIPDSLADLLELRRVKFDRNNFSGKLPARLFDLPKLHSLELSHNSLEGSLPSTIRADSKLERLILINNNLSGELPSWLFSIELDTIQLGHNEFSGPIYEFPKPRYPSLRYLELSGNQLVGSIPSSLRYLTGLYFLILDQNQLSGALEWSNLKDMEGLFFLSMSGNRELDLTYTNKSAFTFPSLAIIKMENCGLTEFPNYFSDLPFLSTLLLGNNRMKGRIEYRNGWKYLGYFDASFNMLDGPLPYFPSLDELNLSHNTLTGEVPESYSRIRNLDLSHNELTGELPTSYCRISRFDLSYNFLTGVLPWNSTNCMNSLGFVNLRNNNLHGTIPDIFGSSLSLLNLNGNNFQGELPRSLKNSDNLRTLDVGNNSITDVFPGWLGGNPRLEVLIISSNNFYGDIGIPATQSPFPYLRVLDASCNNFSGSLPAEYIRNFSSMKEVRETFPLIAWGSYVTFKGSRFPLSKAGDGFTNLDLSHNSFTGSIPSDIGNLTLLTGMNLDHNQLSGEIPSSFGNLVHLESLDLSSNMLSGNIPQELLNSKILEYLNLTNNQFPSPAPFSTFPAMKISVQSHVPQVA